MVKKADRYSCEVSGTRPSLFQGVAAPRSGGLNLDSVARAIEDCGGDPVITNKCRDLERAITSSCLE